MREIRLYIEGGGDGGGGKHSLKIAFNEFFKQIKQLAEAHQIKFNITLCGSRVTTFRDFKNAIKSHPHAFNILLVDSEERISVPYPLSWRHLKERTGDGWSKPEGVSDDNCHLMVQTVEAWFIADPECLKQYYGQGFQASCLPRNTNIEEIEKSILESSLERATRNTTKKAYHKIHHAKDLLAKIDVQKVRLASKYCDRIFQVIEQTISDS